MNTMKKLAITTSLLTLLGACSGDNEPFKEGNNLPPTGIVDANSFSLAVRDINLEALNHDGVTNEITVRAADRHNNPAPNGTVIKFRTNGGSIPSQCLINDGACTVTWTSQNPRPGTNGNPGVPGLVAILAYATGEESFNDLNDNDAFDTGETIADLSEPYLDLNANDSRDANEEFVDTNNNGAFDAADGLYTGTACVGDITVCNRTNLLVWSSNTFVISGLAANFSYSSTTFNNSTSTPVVITITDTNGQPLATGTEISFDVGDGSVDPSTITATGGTQAYTVIYEAPTTPGSTTLKVITKGPVSEVEVNDIQTLTIN